MSKPQIEFAHPTNWPTARPKEGGRKESLFRNGGRRMSLQASLNRLREQCALVTKSGEKWRMKEMTLSTNMTLRTDGKPRRDRKEPSDPAVAFFFELDGEAHVLACDRWDSIADNVAAIAAHIEALRGQERWGVADMKQAFAGHVALPAPEQWWQILGIPKTATRMEIDRAWREKMNDAHPDRGGSNAAAARLNLARDEGRKA